VTLIFAYPFLSSSISPSHRQGHTHTHIGTHKTLPNANSIMLQERKVEEEEEEEASSPACPHAEPEQTL